MQLQINKAVELLSLLLINGAKGQVPAASNHTQTLSGFEPVSKPKVLHASISNLSPQCDALISANLSHAVHLASSPLYSTLVEGSWTKDTQRTPYCFVVPSSATEVSQAIIALNSAGNGAGDWHIAIRSGGHGSDNQNSITNGVVIDLTHLNGTEYNPETKIASIGTGARRGELQEHKVGGHRWTKITGGRWWAYARWRRRMDYAANWVCLR